MVGNATFPKQMLVAEVLQRELFGVDLVHGGAGVGDRTNLIGVELLPPIERGSDVHIHRDHPAELAVHGAGLGQAQHKVEVVGADNKIIFKVRLGSMARLLRIRAVFTMRRTMRETGPAVALGPAVHRIPHSADSGFQAHNLGILNQNHAFSPFLQIL